jgi:hypothetical protein
MSAEPIIDPRTGEVVGDDLAALVVAEESIDVQLRGYGNLYRFRDALRERIAEKRGPAVLPARNRRTDVQRRIAACPRCGETPKPMERAA